MYNDVNGNFTFLLEQYLYIYIYIYYRAGSAHGPGACLFCLTKKHFGRHWTPIALHTICFTLTVLFK